MRLPAPRALELLHKGKAPSPGYLLLGTELYWRDKFYETLRKVLAEGSDYLEIREFDLRHESLSSLLETALTPSLFSPRQLLIARNAQATAARRRKETAPEPSGDLRAYFSRPSSSSVVVFEMMDVDLGSEDWREREKATARLEAFEDLCDVVLLSHPTFSEAIELARREAAERGKKISPAAAEQLVIALDRDLGRMRMEIEKLSLFHPENDTIDVSDVNGMTEAATGPSGLPLAEAVGSGQVEKALESLAATVASGKYPPLVVAEIVRLLRQAIVLKDNRVREPRQAAKVLWTAKLPAPQNALATLVAQARTLSGPGLVRGFELALEAELALRSSPPGDRIILERFVIQLTRALTQAPPRN